MSHAYVENSLMPGRCIRCGCRERSAVHYTSAYSWMYDLINTYWALVLALLMIYVVLVASL